MCVFPTRIYVLYCDIIFFASTLKLTFKCFTLLYKYLARWRLLKWLLFGTGIFAFNIFITLFIFYAILRTNFFNRLSFFTLLYKFSVLMALRLKLFFIRGRYNETKYFLIKICFCVSYIYLHILFLNVLNFCYLFL